MCLDRARHARIARLRAGRRLWVGPKKRVLERSLRLLVLGQRGLLRAVQRVDDHASLESARYQMPRRTPPTDVNHVVSADSTSASGGAHELPEAGCSGSSSATPAPGPAGIPDAVAGHASMESAQLQTPQMTPPADVDHNAWAASASVSGMVRERPPVGCSGPPPAAPEPGLADATVAVHDSVYTDSARHQTPLHTHTHTLIRVSLLSPCRPSGRISSEAFAS